MFIERIGLPTGVGLPVRVRLIVGVGLIARAVLDESLPPAVILDDAILLLVIVVDSVDWLGWRAAYIHIYIHGYSYHNNSHNIIVVSCILNIQANRLLYITKLT